MYPGSLYGDPAYRSSDDLPQVGVKVECNCRKRVRGLRTAVVGACPDHRDSVFSNGERALNVGCSPNGMRIGVEKAAWP